MAKINLLPWREQRRERLRKEFLAVLGAVVAVGVLVAVLGHIVIDGRITHQNERNEYLRSHIRELDKQVAEIKDLHTRRNQLLDRMKVIQDLQGTRPLIERAMADSANDPDGLPTRSNRTARSRESSSGAHPLTNTPSEPPAPPIDVQKSSKSV